MRKTFKVINPHGVVGLGKSYGETFIREETDQDIQILRVLGEIVEEIQVLGEIVEDTSPPPQPTPHEPQKYETKVESSSETIEGEESSEEPKKRRYERRDMKAKE